MRKLLPSPLSSRRKSATNPTVSSSNVQNNPGTSSSNNRTNGQTTTNSSKCKIFGAPLSSHSGIPFVITRLCSYIETESGLQQEGLFRISGNVKLIEKLKNTFDSLGDAPLEEIADVPSAAALVKLFFRELPEPVIPVNMHHVLFKAARDYLNCEYYIQQQQKHEKSKNQEKQQGDSFDDGSSGVMFDSNKINPNDDVNEGEDIDEQFIRAKEKHSIYIQRIKSLVSILPPANFFTLRYLCSFLHRVSQFESSNRMNASSLGIVFGPTVFR